jgi:hypothetical protein
MKPSEWRWFKRRSAIEPAIGHMKQDNRMDRNYLKGTDGDTMNAILAVCGFNLRKAPVGFHLASFQRTGTDQIAADVAQTIRLGRQETDAAPWAQH